MRIAGLSFLLLLLSGAALAGDGDQFLKGAPVQLQADKAYILLRTDVPKDQFAVDIVFVRTLTTDELHEAEQLRDREPRAAMASNVASLWWRDPYVEAEGGSTYLMSLLPGHYVIAGQGYGPPHGFLYADKSNGRMGTCLCLGTVAFDAKAGTITDLGTVLSARTDKPIPTPELAGYERDIDTGSVPIAMGLRPSSPETPVPDQLKALPRVAADYHAAGPFPNYFGTLIDRMAPVAGVLGYDKDGHVLDLAPK